jgi:acyl-CoA synthetase (NDP forming)
MDRLRRAGVPVLMGTETGLRAIRHLLEYSESRTSESRIGETATTDDRPSSDKSFRDSPIRDSAFRNSSFLESSGPVDEFRSKQILSAYGLPVPVEEIAETVEDAVSAAERIGYPVVLKTAEGLMHKTDRGGLVLDLHNPEAARRAYETLAARFGPRVLVQKMHPRGIELILGLVNDPQFGMFLSVGFGGVFVEVFKEVRLLVLPTTAEQIRAAFGSLRGAALLNGVRGGPPVDLDAVVNAALALADFGAAAGNLVAEVDVNPLIAYPDGVVAVDALIVPEDSPGSGASENNMRQH